MSESSAYEGSRNLLAKDVTVVWLLTVQNSKAPRHISGENSNLKRCTHLSVHSSIIYSGQDVGSPGGAGGKEPTCQCRRHRDADSIPRLGRSPGGGRGNPLQYSYLENSMDRGAWRATVHRVSKSWT